MNNRSMLTGARAGLDRRQFIARSAAAAVIVVMGGALIHSREAWGLEVKNLKPNTMRTLVKAARDIYPHDRLADKYYAIAVKSYDEKAEADQALRSMVEEGIANLDELARAKHGVPYADVGWDEARTALLQQVASGALFQNLRSALVVSLYNQNELWPFFGYEGESAAKGGYINRGFNDLTWL
jgi:hypothetical protein